MSTDYKQLLPKHITTSQLITDYFDSVGSLMDDNISYISGLMELVNPNTVTTEFIQKLADLVNLNIRGVDTQQEYQLRRQLIQAVDWYKIKGTYQSLIDVAYLFGLNAEIKDMYTNDYSSFLTSDWFVGDVGSLPSGIPAGYYKSPHFGVFFLLNSEKGTSPNTYLWKSEDMTDFSIFVETIRPVNTVPHYTISLNPVCDESGETQIEPGNVRTSVQSSWSYTSTYFDTSSKKFDTSSVKFDSSLTAFISSITHWKLGTHNSGVSPSTTGFSMGSTVLSGTINSVTTYPEYHEFKIKLPTSTIYDGLTELGLYKNDTVTLVLASTFPSIDKTGDVEMEITVRVNRTV